MLKYNYRTHHVTDATELKTFYEGSAFTITGLSNDEESLGQLSIWLRDNGGGWKNEHLTINIVLGELMNANYGLTGDNRYPNDLTFAIVELDQLNEPMKIAIPRFQIGGRWFDDIVDNNARREGENDSDDYFDEDEDDDEPENYCPACGAFLEDQTIPCENCGCGDVCGWEED